MFYMNASTLKITTGIALLIMISAYFGCNRVLPSDQIAEENWSYSGGNAGHQKYSGLDEINKKNVASLQKAWVYHSGNMAGGIQSTPLVIDGKMYITTPSQEIVALDAANGEEIWRYNPARKEENFAGVNRGIAYYKNEKEELILFTSGNYLNAVDAKTGKAKSSFGDNGRVKLNEAFDGVVNTSPGTPNIYNDLIIVGVMGGTGRVNAYDIHFGKLQWSFNIIPRPDEYGYDSWGDKDYWKTGSGASAWGGISVDKQNGIVYFSTGQPKPDFYRPNNEGKHLHANSIVALKAVTGERVWSYQTVHHDLWDLDLACPPILASLKIKEKTIPGIIQLTKTGNIFLFNRLNGELLSEVEERSVPPSKLPGEIAYPTQPFVNWPEPFSKQVLTENDLTNINPEAHLYAKKIFDQSEVGWFIPPSEKGILYYGIHGGAEWFGGAYEETTNTLYVTANELAWHIKMENINADKTAEEHPGYTTFIKAGCAGCHGAERQGQAGIPDLLSLNKKYSSREIADIIHNGRRTMPPNPQIKGDELDNIINYLLDAEGKEVAANESSKPDYQFQGYNKFLDEEGYPATKPPWGTLNAVDLSTGKITWKVPLGEYKELSDKGVPITGMENFGGCIATKGGLVFVAATQDLKFRAFDKDTGKELWQAQLPYGGYSTPGTYSVNGKQYVVIAATGGGKLGPPTGDTYIAYTLPGD